jgi:DNA-binding MarR family transcriptional regulator
VSEQPPPARVGALARRLIRAVTERTRVELDVAGCPDVRPVHNLVFAQLEDGGTRITDMAARLGVTKQAVTLMVDHLEARGYVARIPDTQDRRAKLVTLTERGHAAAGTSLAVADEIERSWAEQLGRERLAELKRTLVALIESLEPPPADDGTHPGARGSTS